MTTTPAELVRVYRSGFHEGSHFGSVVDHRADRDRSLHQRGDVQTPVFPRSSSKPFQAVAMLLSGADLVGADLALAPRRTPASRCTCERALAMLARAGLTEDDLGCPPALPMDEAARIAVLAAGGGPAPDLHELLRQARRHADRLRRPRAGRRAAT